MGLKSIEFSKHIGAGEALEVVQNSVIPDDLQELLEKRKNITKFCSFFDLLKKDNSRMDKLCQEDETLLRQKHEKVRLAEHNLKANDYRKEKQG